MFFRQVGNDNRSKDCAAADDFSAAHNFVEKQCTEDYPKDGLKAEEQGCDGWLCITLSHNLKRVAGTTGNAACIQNRKCTRKDIIEVWCFKDKHQNTAENSRSKKLDKRKFHSIVLCDEMVTDHDMYCESYRTQHYEEVPLGNAAKTVWHCQKVKTADTEYDAQPHNRSDFFAKKKAENRYNYNIQRRDESRFTGCGENAAELLKQTTMAAHISRIPWKVIGPTCSMPLTWDTNDAPQSIAAKRSRRFALIFLFI